MKFFFADSLDVVSPSFDFRTERHANDRVRQRDDLYPHEMFAEAPYDGMLVSKAIVDGVGASVSGKYTLAQRHRLLRVGVREFFRLDERQRPEPLLTMGDCGAFTYVRDPVPPYSVDEVIDFYEACGFDYGVSVDHVILAYQSDDAPTLFGTEEARQHRERQTITLDLARDFLRRHRERGSRFIPIGVAQGWGPSSYRHSVEELQKIGYDHIAIGGLVPLKTPEILSVLAAIRPAVRDGTQIHLFGVTRINYVGAFSRFGVTSFDSTSPLRQAFKDDKDNYYAPTGAYTAIRVPQVGANAKLKARIVAGVVSQSDLLRLEQASLDALDRFDRDEATVSEVVDLLTAYERLHDGKFNRSSVYRNVLQDRPWKKCPCEICAALGIHVMIFRGAERNRRRGFHNLYVFEKRLRSGMAEAIAARALSSVLPPVGTTIEHTSTPNRTKPGPGGRRSESVKLTP